jgi:nucleoside-diphosphate-sugar epimerase
MREQVVLITGANGEIGHGLIRHISSMNCPIVAIDVNPLDKPLRSMVAKWIVGDILDQSCLAAWLLSTKSARFTTWLQFSPPKLNTTGNRPPHQREGTLNLLRLAVEQSQWQGNSVKFIYPSSIAAYGMDSLACKTQVGKLKRPSTCFDHDVRLQQTVLRTPRALLQQKQRQLCRGFRIRTDSRFPLPAFSGAH